MGDLQKLLETGAWEAPVSVETYRRWINFEDLRVPVLDLAYEGAGLRRMGRIEKGRKDPALARDTARGRCKMARSIHRGDFPHSAMVSFTCSITGRAPGASNWRPA
jgi:hypothetical protein